MRRRKRLPRPLHAAICLLLVLLALVFVRFTCGPSRLLTEKQALRRAQRQSLHIPREPTFRYETQNNQFFAVWDGEEIQTYVAFWTRPGRRGASYNAGGEAGFRLMRVPLIREYSWCHFLQDSGETGWGCTGDVMTYYSVVNGSWKMNASVPLVVKNDDPAVAGGVCDFCGVKGLDGEPGLGLEAFSWPRPPFLQGPNCFLFELRPAASETDRGARRVLYDVAVGEDYYGEGAEAAAVIIWCGEDGKELYRQRIELFGHGEGSDEDGA